MATSSSEINQKPVDIISGRVLLGLIGLLAFLLPILLFFVSIIIDDCNEFQSSISAYYHTGARDAMVGIICALSFAFFAYKGYGDDKSVLNDSLFGTMAAIFALGVAFFPTSVDANESSTCVTVFDNRIYGHVHYVSAVLLFFTLAYFCIFQFTKVDSSTYCFSKWDSLTKKKKSVNRFYIACGAIILFCIALAGLYFLIDEENSFKKSIRQYKPIFWLETVMLWAFAAGWLRKSKFFGVYSNEELE